MSDVPPDSPMTITGFDPPSLPEDPWTRIRVEDGMGYCRSYVKSADENLISVVQDYSRYTQIRPGSLFLTVRTSIIDQDLPMHRLHVHNGDVVQVQVHWIGVLGLLDDKTTNALLTLCPTQADGTPYDHYYGPVTRPDEHILNITLSNIWPGAPPTLIRVRTLGTKTLDQVRKTIGRAFHLDPNTLHFPLHEGYDMDPVDEAAQYGHRPCLTLEKVPRSASPESIHGCQFARPTQTNQPASNLIRIVAEDRHNTTEPQAARSGALFECRNEMRDVMAWLRNTFSLGETKVYITHEMWTLEPSRTLFSLGFTVGETYYITVRAGTPPEWMRAPPYSPKACPLVTVQRHEHLDRLVLVPEGMTATQLLRQCFPTDHPSTLRLLRDGTRLRDNATLVSEGVQALDVLDVEEQCIGGAGRAGRFNLRDSMRVDVPLDGLPGQMTTFDVRRVPEEQFAEARENQNTQGPVRLRIDQFQVLVIEAPWWQVLRPPGYVRLQLMIDGGLSNTGMLSVVAPLAPLRTYLSVRFRQNVILIHNGSRIGAEQCSYELGIGDGHLVVVATPGPTSVLPPNAALHPFQGQPRLDHLAVVPFPTSATRTAVQPTPAPTTTRTTAARVISPTSNTIQDVTISDKRLPDDLLTSIREDTAIVLKGKPTDLRRMQGILRLRLVLPTYETVLLVCAETTEPEILFNTIATMVGKAIRVVHCGDRLIGSRSLSDQEVEDSDELEVYTEQIGGAPSSQREPIQVEPGTAEPDDDEDTDEENYQENQDDRYSETRPAP
ncbi:hypothetical protein OC861_006886, partial [Tilletia horrida]